jgi:hypothetical protein
MPWSAIHSFGSVRHRLRRLRLSHPTVAVLTTSEVVTSAGSATTVGQSPGSTQPKVWSGPQMGRPPVPVLGALLVSLVENAFCSSSPNC